MEKEIKRLNKLVIDCQIKQRSGRECHQEFREILVIIGEVWTPKRIAAIIRDMLADAAESPAESQNIDPLAQDVLQEVLIKVYEQGVWAYKPDTAAFSTYLYRMVYNSVIDVIRRLEREKRIFIRRSNYNPDGGAVTAALQGREADRLIGRLPSELDRQILRRHYIEGEKLVDIARDIGIGRVMVGVHKKRALNELRRILAED